MVVFSFLFYFRGDSVKDKTFTQRFGAQSQQVDLHKDARLLKGHGDLYEF